MYPLELVNKSHVAASGDDFLGGFTHCLYTNGLEDTLGLGVRGEGGGWAEFTFDLVNLLLRQRDEKCRRRAEGFGR